MRSVALGPGTTAPAPAPSGVMSPTPMQTPLPPTPPARSESSASDTSDPPAPGQSFTGGGASACQNPPAPNVGAQTPPPDVAADVSPSQNVELLNQGLWVFNKSGTIQGSGPESLYAFWCGCVLRKAESSSAFAKNSERPAAASPVPTLSRTRENLRLRSKVYLLVTRALDLHYDWSTKTVGS